MMSLWNFTRIAATAAVALAAGIAGPAWAADVTLRVQHFLPAAAPAQKQLIEPWAKAVEEQSKGRIEVKIYPAMQLGGRAPQLIDQVRDGVVDVVWTLPGYTPGRFPKMEVFELPFMINNAEATSAAVQEFYETHAKDEFADVHPLFFHVHAGGGIHTKDKPVRTADDLKGLKLRVPTRATGQAFEAWGVTPVFLPVPQMPEAISKGVIDGASVPWEVMTPLRLQELTNHHAEFTGQRRMQTSTFAFIMNKAAYDKLPADLKAVIDANSGLGWAKKAGAIWEGIEEPGRKVARDRGNTIVALPEAEAAKLAALAQPVTDAWVAEMTKAGKDGKALLESAKALLDKHAVAKN